jgi:trk system potassium uptake protein TrkA
MNIVILGCGRVGARLATILARSHRVTIIDWNASAFDRLGPDFAGDTVVGNGIDVEVLRSVSTGEADLFLALTDGDNRNLFAAQVAKHLGAHRIIARVYDAERAGIFCQMGFTAISPTVNSAKRLFNMVVGQREAL